MSRGQAANDGFSREIALLIKSLQSYRPAGEIKEETLPGGLRVTKLVTW
jgi:hypothetical protein